ncbi:hypothetical protein VE00_00474 [Pseudogymnoascus sp. WSF 3629]|nr:hypothetical protein VE00_00474 [Pseudogymnoascus sp. WSF 3629]
MYNPMYNPKTRELDFEEFSYVNEQGEFDNNRRHGYLAPLSNYIFENFGAVSVSETFPYLIVFCEDKVPPHSERPFKIAGMIAVWVVNGEISFPRDIEMGDFFGAMYMENPWISLDQDLLAEIDVLVIPKAKTLSTIMNDYFPDALAISFISHQILIELIEVTFEEHYRRLAHLPTGFWDTTTIQSLASSGELFWTDNFVTGPQQLASVGKRICKVDIQGNDFFSIPDAVLTPGEYGELVQCIYATSMPPINSQQKIQDGVCGAPIIRARKEENCPQARAKYSAPRTRGSYKRRPSYNTPITEIQKQLPQEETTGEVAGFMDIQYGGDRLLCFADVVDGLVDDGWSVVPVDAKRKVNASGFDGDARPSAAKRSRNE